MMRPSNPTTQDTNWTLYYAKSRSQENRYWKVVAYQGRCWACECPHNSKGRKECDHIKAGKAGTLRMAQIKRTAPRPVVIVEERQTVRVAPPQPVRQWSQAERHPDTYTLDI